MDDILTLAKIGENDDPLVGKPAVALAKAAKSKQHVPLTFVIPTTFFDAFLEQTGLLQAIHSIYLSHGRDHAGFKAAYDELAVHFKNIRFSEHLQESLIDAYDMLAIDEEASDATSLVGGSATPRVSLHVSLTYAEDDPLRGLQQNITTPESFIAAIKNAWLAAYHPLRVLERREKNIDTFSVAIIVEQQPRVLATLEATYEQARPHQIIINSYLGMPSDCSKDKHEFTSDPLRLAKSTITAQAERYVPSETSGVLDHSPLGEQGKEQAAPDEMLAEVARISKRLHIDHAADIAATFILTRKHLLLFSMQLLKPSLVLTQEQTPTPVAVPDTPAPQLLTQTVDQLVIISEDDQEEVPTAEEEVASIEIYERAEETLSINEPELAAQPQESNPAPQQEETLFDLFQANQEGSQPPAQMPTSEQPKPAASFQEERQSPETFVLDAFAAVKKDLIDCYAHNFGDKDEEYANILGKLADADLLLGKEADYRRLLTAVMSIEAGAHPKDDEIGIAWRLLGLHA